MWQFVTLLQCMDVTMNLLYSEFDSFAPSECSWGTAVSWTVTMSSQEVCMSCCHAEITVQVIYNMDIEEYVQESRTSFYMLSLKMINCSFCVIFGILMHNCAKKYINHPAPQTLSILIKLGLCMAWLGFTKLGFLKNSQ